MFGGNFQTWKLHSTQDYLMFFAYILAGLADRETHEQTAEPREGSGKGFRTAEEDLRKAR